MDLEIYTHHASASQDTGNLAESLAESSADTKSAIPEVSGGSWDPCNLDEDVLSSMEQEGLIAAKEISK
jgi:hypothetical protein